MEWDKGDGKETLSSGKHEGECESTGGVRWGSGGLGRKDSHSLRTVVVLAGSVLTRLAT